MFSTWYLWTLSLGVPVRQCITGALMFYSLFFFFLSLSLSLSQVNKIHHLSPILEQDIDEEELFMQELEEERERQMREVEEALFLEEYQNQA